MIIISRLNTIKGLPPLFVFNLACCKFVDFFKKTLSITVFKVITVNRPSNLITVFLMGRSECPTKGGNWRGSTCKPKSLNFPFLFDIFPHKKFEVPVPPLITDWLLLEKKISLIVFRRILPKILPAREFLDSQ